MLYCDNDKIAILKLKKMSLIVSKGRKYYDDIRQKLSNERRYLRKKKLLHFFR